ncbi:rhodanese-like domain-containing protein [Flavicella marina]|uniref:rhodanese-like domain-containing protein n=1 Tax=Flavicella marina TaxID=1475951 RepID=UPI0029391265|nr:rhodanese-like domain-containing protein [Flavicella marina]
MPIIKVSEISSLENYILLDTREKKEYDTSHLKNAECVGFDYFQIDKVLQKYPDKSQPILVYCSIGMRSEMIGEKLLQSGYMHVYNLYGGIFEWKNQEKEVVDKNNVPTEKVHTFSKEWSKWLIKGEKIYEK